MDSIKYFMAFLGIIPNSMWIFTILILIGCLIFKEDAFIRKGIRRIIGFGLLVFFILLINFSVISDTKVLSGILDLIVILAAVYILDLVYNILKKEIRLGIECLDVPQNIEERGFTKEFIIKEIRLTIGEKLRKNKNIKELNIADLANEEYKKSVSQYLKNIPLEKISEIKNISFFNFQLPVLKRRAVSKLEISFGEDEDHLHILASLDGKLISKTVIKNSKHDFYDEFTRWIYDFSEVLFLTLLPPCLRLYYIFKIYKKEVVYKFDELAKNKKCYNFNDLLIAVKTENRNEILKLISEKTELLEDMKKKFYMKKKIPDIERLKKKLENIKKEKDLFKVLDIKGNLKNINEYMFEQEETFGKCLYTEVIKGNLKNINEYMFEQEEAFGKRLYTEVILSNFLDYLQINCREFYCKDCNEFSEDVKKYNKKYCDSCKKSREIAVSIKSYLILLKIKSLAKGEMKDKKLEIKELTKELKKLTILVKSPKKALKCIEQFYKNIKNIILKRLKTANKTLKNVWVYVVNQNKKVIYSTLSKLENMAWESEKDFYDFIYDFSQYLIMKKNYRYNKKNNIEELFKSPNNLAKSIQRACVELASGEWKKVEKILKKYKKNHCKISQVHGNLMYAYYCSKKYEACLEEAYNLANGSIKKMYLFLIYKGCSLYRLWKLEYNKELTNKHKEKLLGHLNNYKDIISGKYQKKYGYISDWQTMRINYLLMNFDIKCDISRKLKEELGKILEEEIIERTFLKHRVLKLIKTKLDKKQPLIVKENIYKLNEYITDCLDNFKEKDIFEEGLVYLLYNLGVLYYHEGKFSEAKKYFSEIIRIEEYHKTPEERYEVSLKDCKLYIEACEDKGKYNPLQGISFKKGENIDFYFSGCLKLGINRSGELIVAEHNYKFATEIF